jgi:hypothetical protein
MNPHFLETFPPGASYAQKLDKLRGFDLESITK